MTAALAPFAVHVFRLDGSRGRLADSRVHIQIDTHGAIESALRMEVFRVLRPTEDGEDGTPISTRDVLFDRLVRVEGPAAWVFARLDHRTRQRLIALLRDDSVSFTLTEGRILFDGSLSFFSSGRGVDETVDELVALAKRFAAPSTRLADELHDNAASEPIATVRQRMFELQWFELGDARAVQSSLRDPSATVRLEIGSRLGERGFEHLVSGLLDASNEDLPSFDLAARAVCELIEGFDDARVEPVLEALLEPGAPLAFATAQALARTDHPLAFEWAKASDPLEWPAALIDAMLQASLGRPEAEPMVFAVLERRPETEARVTAAEVLGSIGGASAAGRLRPLTARFAAPAALRKAAQRAIDEIEGRHADASGALSVTQAERGQLSTAPRRGALSRTD